MASFCSRRASPAACTAWRPSGGKPQQVLALNESKSERADLWPQFLPDGKHFVFYQQTDLAETSGVYAGSLEQAEYRRLFTSQTNAVYSAVSPDSPKSGYLLYINERILMAQQFNAGRLETADDPIALANDIGAVRSLALAPISVSTTGVLVYESVGQSTRQMVWMDRAGRQIATAGEPGAWGPPRISPDGRRAVVAKTGADGMTAHLWLLDANGGAQQISDGPMHEGSPVWSPDGSRIAYFGKQGDSYDIFARAAQAGAKGELLLKSSDKKFPSDWSHDGRNIIFSMEGAGTRLDVWGLSLADRHPAPIVNTVYAEGFATISPDGKWIAYQSDQSGRNEVYVQTFDGLTERHQAALDGVQGRRTAPLARRQQRVVLHDDGRPHHERSDSPGRRRQYRARSAADALPDAAGSADLEPLRRRARRPALRRQYSTRMDRRGADYGVDQLGRKNQVNNLLIFR